MKHNETLTELVRNAVAKSGLSQYELAKRCGFSNKLVGRLLRGADIRLGTAQKILNAIGLQARLDSIEKEIRP